ncbi:MAG: two-component system response regulator KdpE [Hydrogenophaga sp.]|uniref:two-component system response regulator KdpE n=1 Tax=Hydrogenophaga sp. TaxID=1904254 RepID=UPI0016B914E0|nr:two-component system response regulator KdpE [Hydrogenophaga sp.]NIM42214.1 two-component system response regulator KdpE [Hydrogenophaga sp.]NIN27946.1 two-component system response regulator KdpE [Hydrogenophaga sp.]NIN32724.1 two-component system response regulator KdpE [Hydrogenophaga sp.]NIN54613.1 two-component system response regulator KdpE [Hydrogenophaga sp.]NIO51289.1 two-component system response regulator KdpE [Hydrogenophaga sp.]
MSTHAPQILVVEDEADIRRFVRLTLQAEGHEVHEAATLQRGLIEAGTRRPDLVVLDLGLPDGDGVDLIRDLRQWSAVPVIVLSARSAEASKIEALDAGADDYLVKPFGSGELMARVRAQLRRHLAQTPAGESVIRFGEVAIDLARHQVQRAGEPLRLTPIEYKLLTHLASQPERVITHAQLLQAVWGPGHREDTHYVRVHMANLRKKIELHPAMPRHLLTETGIGYRFVP